MASLAQALILAAFYGGVTPLHADSVLNERAVYERCHAKLVRLTPQPNDPFVSQIAAGTLTGAAACKQLLRLPAFDSTNKISSSLPAGQQDLAKSVLQSINELHVSWFENKGFIGLGTCNQIVTNTLVDTGQPALFFTRAVYDPQFDLSSVLKSNDIPRAIRSVDSPSESIFDYRMVKSLTPAGFPSSLKWTPNGDLLGVGLGDNPTVAKLVARTAASDEPTGPLAITNAQPLANQGGGILGSQSYLMNNYGDDPDLIPSLIKMPRKWSRYVFKDFLCRDLPVIAEADAVKWAVCSNQQNCGINPTKSPVLPFRQDKACVRCHASMDQLGSLARGFRGFRAASPRCTFSTTTQDPTPVLAAIHVLPEPPKISAPYNWDYVLDPTYHEKTPLGRFVYRPMNGGPLIDHPLTSMNQLGTEIESLEDFYICAAKRYYLYFTGIDVSLEPMTPAQENNLAPDQKYYRQTVMALGRKLQKPANQGGFNKDPKKLIDAIFDMPDYKQKDFGIQSHAQAGN